MSEALALDLGTISDECATVIAQALLDDLEPDLALKVVQAHTDPIIMADDGNAEVEMVSDSFAEAAQEYVDDGDWGDSCLSTDWVTIYVWRRWILGDIVIDEERESFSIAIEPQEPECLNESGHEWVTPYKVLGGLPENPGCWGHGGGIIQHEVCVHCGTLRTTDTWAQRRDTGEQGLTSITYTMLHEHDFEDSWLAWKKDE